MRPQELARTLESIVLSAEKEFSSASYDWDTKPATNKWSKKEILGHLNDSALNNVQRFVRIQYGDQTNIFYDQDFWVQASNYQKMSRESIQNIWKLNNLHIANVWENIDEKLLGKTILVKDEEPTLLFLMEDYIDHLNHHLKQIRG